MQTLYIDHSIVTDEPSSWEHVHQATASGKVRLAMSVWNLFEIGDAADEAQRERRIAFFVDGTCPLWVVERVAIQQQEVERFLWQQKFGATPRELIAITPSLSVVDSFFASGQTRTGLTARQFIRGIDFASLRPSKRLSPNALKNLQNANPKTRKLKEEKDFTAWIEPLIPDRGPDGHALTISEKTDLLAFCWQREKLFLRDCRCLAVEDALTTARTSDPRRSPTESDGLDLQHAAVALAYCNIFYSRDGYQTQCAALARKALTTAGLSGLSAVCRTPKELATAIAGLPISAR
jgi:hypothetical protein